MDSHDSALSDLRYYLKAWRGWVRSWREKLGYPSEAPFVRLCRPVVEWGGEDSGYHERSEEVDEWIIKAIDTEVENLPVLKRAAVRLIYLREVGPAMFRSGRMSIEEASRLCDLAERDMVPKLRDKGIVLGGV